MKLLSLLTLSLCCYVAEAQGPIAFHMYLKPATVYQETMQRTMKLSFNYDSADASIKQAMENNPQIATLSKPQANLMETAIHCGKVGAGGTMPVWMEVTQDTGAMVAAALPAGTMFYGKVHPGKLPEYDSVSAGVSGEQKEALLKVIQSVAAQIALPDTTLSVNQSYTQLMAIDIPAGPMQLKMNFTMIYTLRGYSADTAGFDIQVKGTLGIDGQSTPVPITGGAEGWGHLVYDRKGNYYQYMRTVMTMNMDMKQAGMGMTIAAHSDEARHCIVRPE
jgi:hypothetical protein